MYEFDFWYAYFDSLFLKDIPLPHLSFLQRYMKNLIQRFDFSDLSKQAFPECKKLPSISKCFQEFENFIFSPETWIQCQCDQQTLSEIQNFVNNCVILIFAQKKYGQEFWHLKRRIQASICHFFSILIFLIGSLIPENKAQTIQETKRSNKLCISLKSLEDFVNKILPEMNSIIKFLYQQSFKQEKKLTILFLQQVKQVLLSLLKVQKKTFNHQFYLTRYLYLIIPIQISKNQYKFKTKRKKAVTISNEIQMKYHSDEFLSIQTKQDQFNIKNTDQKRKFSLSKLNQKQQKQIYRTKIIKNKQQSINHEALHQINTQTSTFLPKLFKFSQKVRKSSFYVSQKKVTKATLNTRETMELKLQAEKLRKKSQFGKISEPCSKDRQILRTFSIQKQRQKTIETVRSKKSSFQRVHRITQIQQSQKLRHHKQKSLAKDKVSKKFTIQQIISKPQTENIPHKPSKKINFQQGKIQGWGIIQEDFNKQKIIKDIQKIIHSQIHLD